VLIAHAARALEDLSGRIEEFKNKKLNKLIDYSLLKNSIVNDLENNCQVYDFDISNLENLKFN